MVMALEGSVFKVDEPGKLIDLDDVYAGLSTKVGHKVYVNGISFLIKADLFNEQVET